MFTANKRAVEKIVALLGHLKLTSAMGGGGGGWIIGRCNLHVLKLSHCQYSYPPWPRPQRSAH